MMITTRAASGLLLALHFLLLVAMPTIAEELIIDSPEMAGISGFRQYWDKPVFITPEGKTRDSNLGRFGSGPVADWSTDEPGAPVFDAIHRRLLIRFPGAAEQLAEALNQGKQIDKVELALPFIDVEYHPMDYLRASGMSFLGDLWVRLPPRWHAVAYVLREPWQADTRQGPTWNASVNGTRYWNRWGAQDTGADRFPQQFGPAEVSHEVTEGRLDITALLADPVYGESLAQRLRVLSDQGLILRKWETYDALYNHGGYEYGGAPGGRGIRIGKPTLIVTLKAGQSNVGDLPPAAQPAKLPRQGQPTAILPDAQQIAAHIERFRFQRPDHMPRWQWRRLQELRDLQQGRGGDFFPESADAYYAWVDHLLSMPYRQFSGHHTPVSTHQYLLHRDAMPAPLREHMGRYWEAWLMPERPYHELAHNQWTIWTAPADSYYARTGDWRGNHSFYRESYTRFMSTMNFNHLSIMGALLGGAVIDSEHALADGRYGLEHYLLRLWSWYDGTTQESIDHYYLGLTLLGQKSFADLGPTAFDRLMGDAILLKTTDELAGAYHPALKRFIASSGRTGIANLLAINEGPNHILHTVSTKGTLHDIDNRNLHGMPAIGSELPPAKVAQQAALGDWLPIWMGNIVDNKALPFEMTSTFKQWGTHHEKPLWKRTYLGRSYGLASLDIAVWNQTVPVMAQWRRHAGESADIQEIGTLLVRHGINRTEFFDSLFHGTDKKNPNGSVGTQGGSTATLQWRNKAIVLASPYKELKYPGGRPIPEAVTSLQTSIALTTFEDVPTWQFVIDGKPVDTSPDQLPIALSEGSRIAIRDGITYIGLIPLASSSLARSEQVIIRDGGEPVELQSGGYAAPTLVIDAYSYHQPDQPLDKANADWRAIDRAASGFMIEVADAADYASFEAFQAHLAAIVIDSEWQDEAGLLRLTAHTGDDEIALTYRPEYEGDWNTRVPADRCFPERTVNGRWPYLPAGLERDSNVSQQGRTGRLEKLGAVMTFQPGRMGFLLHEPISGNIRFSNPLPDPQYMVMDAPGGIRLKADGKLSLMHLTINPRDAVIDLGYALHPNQPADAPELATALFVFGLDRRPTVKRNGELLAHLPIVELDMQSAYMIPLTADAAMLSTGQLQERFRRSSMDQLAALSAVGAAEPYLRYRDGEHYLLSTPRAGAHQFIRLWPGASPYEVVLPTEKVRLVIDGNLALQRLLVAPGEPTIDIDYAPYLQKDKQGQPIENRAKALLVFGLASRPAVILHGKPYTGEIPAVEIDGQQAWLVPLFDEPPAELVPEAQARYQAALERLQPVANPQE